ncbi:sialate O-acetylesterase (plasmid) [Hymenobacter tibetensis]|uniref:Sialate O-acetylesterase n=1 Tax=Hymenobacter tibetensis TaxID=497967 RepID=A0ABY4D772_9BACT|nr:sialate O-acetylesterase [Hymenobacter tibetensis]UOG77445.1 sialate O-acetylesterase [Hymenobacter tibetensis]
MPNKQCLSITHKAWQRLGWSLLGWLFCLPALAQQAASTLKLAEVWQSGMVIQRNQPITLWGKGVPGAQVRATFHSEQRTATIQLDSTWTIGLTARPASTTPSSMQVESRAERIVLQDVLLGDVWLCAGQSNMAFPLVSDQFAKQILPQVHNPLLRLFNQLPTLSTYKDPYKLTELDRLTPAKFYRAARWQKADSVSARAFSAVGYYAGQLVQQQTGIPIGLIHVAIGGSPAEAWLRPLPAPQPPVAKAIFAGNWFINPALEPWCIQRGHENLDSLLRQGAAVPRDSLGYNHPFKPGFLYEAAMQPLLQLGLTGILWYQGESNALSLARVEQHEQLFPQLVAGWRAAWRRPDLPVYTCQLSSIGTEKGYKSENWPLFRDGQRRLAATLPHVGMAVTSDVGHPWDVHPTNKKVVGERLARVMLTQTYCKSLLVAPLPGRVRRHKDGWVLQMAHAGAGLRTADGQVVRGFAVGDATGPQADLSAQLQGKQVILTGVSKGQYLYYGWQPFTTANVVNSDALPLTTFRLPLP